MYKIQAKSVRHHLTCVRQSIVIDGAPLPEQVSPLDFIRALSRLNARPLIEQFDGYRLRIMVDALFSFDDDGLPRFNLVLCGRAKKNFKTTDLIVAALYQLLAWKSLTGSNECYVLANDADQARDEEAHCCQ